MRVRVQPGARRSTIVGWRQGALKVAVTAPPEKGLANRAMIALLSQRLKIQRSGMELISGHTSRLKRLLIRGLSSGEVQRRLEKVLSEHSRE